MYSVSNNRPFGHSTEWYWYSYALFIIDYVYINIWDTVHIYFWMISIFLLTMPGST